MSGKKESGNQKLAKRLTLTKSVSIIMGSVIGSGLLILPGFVYQQKGVYSFYSWISMSIFIIPLLYIFTKIGRNFPSAGGVVNFIIMNIGKTPGSAITYMLLSSFILMVPMAAIIGINYVGFIIPISEVQIIITAFLVLVISTILNTNNPAFTLRVQSISATCMVLFFIVVIGVGLNKSFFVFMNKIQTAPINAPHAFVSIWGGMTLVFWAYLGWENVSFTTEEFINVEKVLLRATVLGYSIMTFLYLGLSASAIGLLDPFDKMTAKAPLAAMISNTAAGYWGGIATAIVACIIMVMNINAWVWGSSRLVYASSRQGLLFGNLSLINKQGTPANALVFLLVPYFIIMLIMLISGKTMMKPLITIVNANFVLLYMLTIFAFAKHFRSKIDLLMSAIAFFLSIYFFVKFGLYGLCCFLFFLIIAITYNLKFAHK